jgi:uncharacterized protein HemX
LAIFVIESRKSLFSGEFAMKIMGCTLLLVLGLALSVPAVAQGDTNRAHATQGDSTKSMKAYRKQQKKQQKQTRNAEKKTQKKAKKKAASPGQAGH